MYWKQLRVFICLNINFCGYVPVFLAAHVNCNKCNELNFAITQILLDLQEENA